MSIKAIIFDMDGVLIDAKDWHYDALNKALRLFGMEISRYDHIITYDGLPTHEKLEMLSVERGLPKGLHRFINEMKQVYTLEYIYSRCKPLFVHEYALARLKKEGYKLAVCSNSIRDTIETMLTQAKILHYFDFIISNQDVKKGKPDPEMYNAAIQRLGLTPKECLILEDNENGIKAAIASKAHLLKIETVYDVTYDNINRAVLHA